VAVKAAAKAGGVTISAHGLCRRFGTRIAVHDVSLELKHGEVLGFLGPNGAGKTTIMRLLTGNLAPSAGRIEICGINLLEKPREAKARIGYLPEIPPLYRELTVNEYLRFAARLHQVENGKIDSALNNVAQRCGLGNIGRRLIGSLSKGYQQRVGIAQAIIHDPEVIIFDEPTAGLDPNQMRDIRTLIRELGAERSVILSTHILPEVESLCDRVQIMNEGRLVFGGSMDTLKQEGTKLEEVFVRSTLGNFET
jgi:ABC-2 type transport system ATP-binding protein